MANPQELQTSGAKFDIGAIVEVCPKDRDAWFPATLLKQVNDNQFIVEYVSERMQDLVGKVIETVDSFHIRPCPPDISHDKNFNLLEMVDAFYDCGWWSGVVDRVLAGSKYVVFLKHRNEWKEFTQSELRCHMDWIGGKWVEDSKDIPVSNTAHKGGQTSFPIQTRSQTAGKTYVSSPPNGGVVKKVQSTCKSELLPPHKKLKTIGAIKTPPSLKHCHVGRMSAKDGASAVEQHNIAELPKGQLKLNIIRTTRQETGPSVSSTEAFVRGEEQSPARGRSHVPGDTMETQAKGHEQAITCGEGVSWSFKKESPFWEIVESLKVFQMMPQKPHFRPLDDEYRLNVREGQAIGSMLTFSSVVEMICDLKGDELTADLHNMLEALPRLESLGLDVDPIEARLKDLISVKHKQEQLNHELMTTREYINRQQLNEERLKLKEDEMRNKVEEMGNMIKELQHSFDSLMKEIESTAIQRQIEVSSISELKRSMDTIEGQITESTQDFYSLKSAPWGTSLQME